MNTDAEKSVTVLVIASPERQRSIVQELDGGFDEVQTATPDDVDQQQVASAECLVFAGGGKLNDGLPPADIDHDADLAVVLVAENPTESLLAEAAARGRTVVPATQLDSLQEAVTTTVSRRSERNLFCAVDQLFDAVEDTLFVKDTAARHLYLSANPELPDPETAIGKTDRELYDNRFEFGKQWYEDDKRVLETRDPILGEIETYEDDYGNKIHNRVTVVPWLDDDQLEGVVGIRHEVTDRVEQTADLERKNRKLDQFVNYLSHDLQTPLQIASGHLELARDGDEDALDHVETALDRIDALVEDMATLAREDAEASRSIQRHMLADVLEEIWTPLDTGGATLDVDVPERAQIYAEGTALRPFLENLFKNSLDHGPDDVTVTVGLLGDGFYVEDDGPGIPEAHRKAIFHQGFTTTESGSGTGLSIVADAASSHRWNVEVTESDNGGARFEIRNCQVVSLPEDAHSIGESLTLTDNCDVGDPAVKGSTVFEKDGQRATLRGGGEDIFGAENEFQFAYAKVKGDVRISAHLVDLDARHSFSKAGVTIRDSLEEDALHAHVGRTPEYGIELLWRTEAGEPTVSQHPQERFEYEWFRVDRLGDTVNCWVSRDGTDWQLLDQRSVHFEEPVYVGLAVSSVVPRNLTTGQFDAITLNRLQEQ